MFSYDLFRLIADEREREIQELIRIQRLLELHDVVSELADAVDDGDPGYPDAWRARAPRASATTR
jgi:hypothetical protein